MHSQRLGGVVHTYQKYDPRNFPSPTQPAPDMLSGAFDHMLAYGSRRKLTPEELARAVRLDPSEIAGLGPSIDALIAMLLERKRKILERYETDGVRELARQEVVQAAATTNLPQQLAKPFRRAVQREQLYDLERVWYEADRLNRKLGRQILPVLERLGEKYQVDELAARWEFTGRAPLTVPEALLVKEELERIDELLKQLEEARQSGQIALVDMDALAEFAEPGQLEQLDALRQLVEDYVREMAERQGIENRDGHFALTPRAYRLFQGQLLERIFSQLQASRSGRHAGEAVGDGAVELQQTKPYEFGDSIANLDVPQTLINAMIRQQQEQASDGARQPLRLATDDIVVHKTRNNPKCATAVIMDMSGSMRYEGQYINVKRMALALDGLIRSEYPGDYLQFIEMATFGRVCPPGEIIDLLPKPVTIYDPIVRLKADMSRDDISQLDIPPHFTNIQHSLQTARRLLAAQDTPNRQVILITDGLPTAHFDDEWLMLLYPPDQRTEDATMREGRQCRREGIVINLFMVPSWSQSEEDIQFAHRLAKETRGRVFFTAGGDLDRYVIWDYVNQRREIVG